MVLHVDKEIKWVVILAGVAGFVASVITIYAYLKERRVRAIISPLDD
jgi:hypothetical protein